MPDFRIFQTDEYLKKMSKLPANEAEFLEKKLREYVFPQLLVEPFYGKNIKKLRKYTPTTWRYRIGKYRLFYIINPNEKIIYLLTMDLRKDAYRN
ncbi:MAG: type II toxin-antitoxin system RelE/ParE family toxin [Candidatus Fermentibacteraceae bacterium]